MTDKIRILVADDHPIVREGLVLMLGTQVDFEVVGEAENGKQLLLLVDRLTPDVILLDLEMPEMDGLQVLLELQKTCPTCQVLVFTAFNTDERIVGAIQAGAKGYMLKGSPRKDVFDAIRVVSRGESLLQPIVASKLMSHMRKQADEPEVDPLTERETEVLEELAQGSTNKEIAEALVISERTVKFHISSILSKLGAGNRTEAVTIAVSKGLITIKGD